MEKVVEKKSLSSHYIEKIKMLHDEISMYGLVHYWMKKALTSSSSFLTHTLSFLPKEFLLSCKIMCILFDSFTI